MTGRILLTPFRHAGTAFKRKCSTKWMALKQRATVVMSDPRRVNLASPLAWLLWICSKGYGVGVRLRNQWYQRGGVKIKRLPCPVVSIGNITAGGTGKTPMTLYLARLLQQEGKQVAVISRGYKGRAGKQGAVVSNGQQVLLPPFEAGDEPYLMAHALKKVPVIVGHDRYKAGQKAVRQFNPDIILLDDGFQHRRLHRDIDIVLLDARSPFGNTHLLPRGLLREPLSSLERADLFILTRTASLNSASALKVLLPSGRPVFCSDHRPSVRNIIPADGAEAVTSLPPIEKWGQQKGFAFSGIARNEEVGGSIRTLGFSLNGFMEFPDHHAYTPEDLTNIVSAARNAGAGFLLTTDKDAVRIPNRYQWPMEVVVIGVDIDFGEEQLIFETCILERIERILSL